MTHVDERPRLSKVQTAIIVGPDYHFRLLFISVQGLESHLKLANERKTSPVVVHGAADAL